MRCVWVAWVVVGAGIRERDSRVRVKSTALKDGRGDGRYWSSRSRSLSHIHPCRVRAHPVLSSTALEKRIAESRFMFRKLSLCTETRHGNGEWRRPRGRCVR